MPRFNGNTACSSFHMVACCSRKAGFHLFAACSRRVTAGPRVLMVRLCTRSWDDGIRNAARCSGVGRRDRRAGYGPQDPGEGPVGRARRQAVCRARGRASAMPEFSSAPPIYPYAFPRRWRDLAQIRAEQHARGVLPPVGVLPKIAPFCSATGGLVPRRPRGSHARIAAAHRALRRASMSRWSTPRARTTCSAAMAGSSCSVRPKSSRPPSRKRDSSSPSASRWRSSTTPASAPSRAAHQRGRARRHPLQGPRQHHRSRRVVAGLPASLRAARRSVPGRRCADAVRRATGMDGRRREHGRADRRRRRGRAGALGGHRLRAARLRAAAGGEARLPHALPAGRATRCSTTPCSTPRTAMCWRRWRAASA